MSDGQDPEKSAFDEKNLTSLFARARKCLSANIYYLDKANELKNTVAKKLHEQRFEFRLKSAGAEPLRISRIIENCRGILEVIEESIKTLGRRIRYLECLLKREDEGHELRGNDNMRSGKAQNKKGFRKQSANAQANAKQETLLSEIQSAEAMVEGDANILYNTEEKFYEECERSKPKPESAFTAVQMQRFMKKQHQLSNLKCLPNLNAGKDKTETNIQQKSSPTKTAALLVKKTPEKNVLLMKSSSSEKFTSSPMYHISKTGTTQTLKDRLSDDQTADPKMLDIDSKVSTKKENPCSSKHLSPSKTTEGEADAHTQEKVSPTKTAALVVKTIPKKTLLVEFPTLKQTSKTKPMQTSKVCSLEDANDDDLGVSKISDIPLEDSTKRQNPQSHSKHLGALETIKDQEKTQKKTPPTKRATLVEETISKNKELMELPDLKQCGTSKTFCLTSKDHCLDITDKTTNTSQASDCEIKRSVFKTSEKSAIDSVSKRDDGNVDRHQEVLEELNAWNEAKNLKANPDIADVAIEGLLDERSFSSSDGSGLSKWNAKKSPS